MKKSAILWILIAALLLSMRDMSFSIDELIQRQQMKAEAIAERAAVKPLRVRGEHGQGRTLSDTTGYATEMPFTDELDLLALVVEAEAGNQDLTGKRLVIDVVLNRVESPLFPDTITEVLMQPGQFTTVVNGGIDRARQNMQEDDYTAVAMEVTGERLDYNIYYFNNTGYIGKPAYQYGDHYFGTIAP